MFAKICTTEGLTRDWLHHQAQQLGIATSDYPALSLHIRELLNDAGRVLARAAQALAPAYHGESLAQRQLREGREDIRQLAVALEYVAEQPADQLVRDVIRTTISTLFKLQTALCGTCSGQGLVGGGDGSGFDADACPDCQTSGYGASSRSSAVAFVQAMHLLDQAMELAAKHGADTSCLSNTYDNLCTEWEDLSAALTDGPKPGALVFQPALPAGTQLVGRSELALAMNALWRDAEDGRQVRADMHEELVRSLDKYN